MSYTVLARRYRSQSFDELVGQEAIARTLRTAIDQNRVAHAYLFVGTRGVGKTSSARLFAKALAGGSPEVDAAIMSGQDTDVIEIDAASNSKVEETRDLIANAVYRPLRGRVKVYIIDEVHMLSTASFNALLKTLEEPPEHVKFILCTTESHKVPATIQSRCQRFDFRALSATEIAAHLAAICKKEKVKADAEALHAVARLGNGSMRDALSLLDRLMAACAPGEGVTVELLERLLGLPQRRAVSAIIDAIGAQDAAAALRAGDTLLGSGHAIEQMLEALILRLRDLMLLRVCGEDSTLVELSDAARDEAVKQSANFDEAGLVHMIALCESVQRLAKSSSTPRAMVDALLVRLAMTDRIAEVAGILSGANTGATGASGGTGSRARGAPARSAARADHDDAPVKVQTRGEAAKKR